ncbi:MAG: copper-binding protein [Myxococcales bacterium]|nr:copper-binding protein [Myxococcales bacterium]
MRSILLILAFVASACGRSSTEGSTAARVDHYSARGKVTTLPGSGAHRELEIHHETIPAFKGEDGKAKSMMSMPMPFGVPDTLKLDAIAVGDVVRFGFDVRWTTSPTMTLTDLEKLPASTPLVLE